MSPVKIALTITLVALLILLSIITLSVIAIRHILPTEPQPTPHNTVTTQDIERTKTAKLIAEEFQHKLTEQQRSTPTPTATVIRPTATAVPIIAYSPPYIPPKEQPTSTPIPTPTPKPYITLTRTNGLSYRGHRTPTPPPTKIPTVLDYEVSYIQHKGWCYEVNTFSDGREVILHRLQYVEFIPPWEDTDIPSTWEILCKLENGVEKCQSDMSPRHWEYYKPYLDYLQPHNERPGCVNKNPVSDYRIFTHRP